MTNICEITWYEMTDRQIYRAGDKVTIILDREDANALNGGGMTFTGINKIIHHEPAPMPEKIVIYQYRDDGTEWFSNQVLPTMDWYHIRKLILDPETKTYTIEEVK